MGKARKLDLDHRLEAYFATLRSSSLREALKRSVGNWQIYAAVGGSAMAMATGTSTSIIGSGGRVTREPVASVRVVRPQPASSNSPPFPNDARLAALLQRQVFSNGVGTAMSQASQNQAPSIEAGGVVPIGSTVSIIQPGELVSIYGQNLANETASWNGDFPTSLGGTSVTINGKAAYLLYVSPSQINLQAPDDTAMGTVPVVVTTAAGTTKSAVTLNQFGPSLCLVDQQYVAAIILRLDGSGAYGRGTYDILGPTGTLFGYPTVAARAGDIVEVYGVGFGPTTPAIHAGKPFVGAAITSSISIYINNVRVEPMFVGLSSAGLYQINLTVPPNLGEGEVPIQVSVGGQESQTGVLFSLQSPIVTSTGVGTTGGTGGGFGGGFGSGTGGGFGGGSGGGTGGGSGGGSGGSGAIHKKPYQPRLRFGSDVDKVENV